jgi:hypothetical protein
MFRAPGLIFGGIKGRQVPFSKVPSSSGPIFMFCPPGLVFSGTWCDVSRFHVLCSRTRFRRNRERRVPFSCFALPDSFSMVPRVSGPIFMFCDPELIFGSTEGVGFRFHVLRSRTYFLAVLRAMVPFSTVPRASGPVFMIYAPGHIFGSVEGVGSCFHVLRSRTRFRWYRGHRVSFSCFALGRPVSFIMFCAPGHVFGCIEGDKSRFHVLRSRTLFRRY